LLFFNILCIIIAISKKGDKMKVIIGLLISAGLLFATAIDINNASKSELMELKGVGSKTAQAIIAYREHKCFKNIESLEEVKGIGPKFIQKNKEKLRVGKCKK